MSALEIIAFCGVCFLAGYVFGYSVGQSDHHPRRVKRKTHRLPDFLPRYGPCHHCGNQVDLEEWSCTVCGAKFHDM